MIKKNIILPGIIPANQILAIAVLFFLCTGMVGTVFGKNGDKEKMDKIRKILEENNIPDAPAQWVTRKPLFRDGADFNPMAIAYGCYREGQAPGVKGPSVSEIKEDLAIIEKYWTLIRVYGADDDTERILSVIQKGGHNIKVVLGIWLENEEGKPEKKAANIKQVLRGIEQADKYENIIESVCVGNETMVSWSYHRMQPEHLIKYLRVVRNYVKQPVTTADDYSYWNLPESKKIAAELDFIITHIHPLWNGIQLEESVNWLDKVYYEQLVTNHPGKEIVIGETGWSTDYDATKTGPGEQGALIKGVVNEEAQKEFMKMIYKWVEDKKVVTYLFEAFDEPWKGGGDKTGPREVEKHWGIFGEDRKPKMAFRELGETFRIKKENKKP
ncbi:MAG: hypothetical protein HUU54_15785 [Ignavibacteriaceae bacterium]|nr:hypothetical protein [Ignavibacteriaceae bacterium]